MGPVAKWFVFTIVAGLIPYGLVVSQHHRNTGEWTFPPSPELLFLAVIAFATVLGEIQESDQERRRAPRFRTHYAVLMIFGVVLSAAAYGAFVGGSMTSPGRRAGVDCAAVIDGAEPGAASPRIEADSVRGALARRWGSECGEWHAVQLRAFHESIWIAGCATALGLLGMLAYGPPMKRRTLPG